LAGTRDIFNAIADEKALALFDAIAVSDDSNTDILITKVRLSRKEYYMRISRLVKAGLASRQTGTYSLTMLGQIVYQAQLAIDHAVDISPKLKAVDMLKNSSNIPEEERNKVINFLLSSELSKNILLQRSWRQD
jgi:predicted transcriptional regulator